MQDNGRANILTRDPLPVFKSLMKAEKTVLSSQKLRFVKKDVRQVFDLPDNWSFLASSPRSGLRTIFNVSYVPALNHKVKLGQNVGKFCSWSERRFQ